MHFQQQMLPSTLKQKTCLCSSLCPKQIWEYLLYERQQCKGRAFSNLPGSLCLWSFLLFCQEHLSAACFPVLMQWTGKIHVVPMKKTVYRRSRRWASHRVYTLIITNLCFWVAAFCPGSAKAQQECNLAACASYISPRGHPDSTPATPLSSI